MSNLYQIYQRQEVKQDECDRIVEEFLEGKAKTTQDNYRAAWRHFTDWWRVNSRGRSVIDITPLQVQNFFLYYRKRPGQGVRIKQKVMLADTTLKKVTFALASCFEAILDEHRIKAVNPFLIEAKKYKNAETTARRETKLTPFEKVTELISCPNPHLKTGVRDRALLAILYGGALRRSEPLKLKLVNVKISGDSVTIMLFSTKNRQEKFHPIAPEFAPYIIDYYNQRVSENPDPGAHLFIEYKGNRIFSPQENKPLSASALYKMFKAYCKIIGLPSDISPHSARATPITKLLEDGFSHREVQSFSRHKSITMVETYDKLRNTQAVDMAAALSFAKK